VEKIKDVFEKQQRIEKQKITPDLFDAAQRLTNEATKLFEGKDYKKSLGKYQESLSKFIDARNGAKTLGDERLVKAIEIDIHNVKKNIIACENAIGISLSKDAKESFDAGNYEDAITAYKNAIAKFGDAIKDAKEIEDPELVERIEGLIKDAEENIESCKVAIDKREVENLFKESKSLHEKAVELARGGEMFSAKDVFRGTEAKINSAFEVSTKRKFLDATNKLNLLLKTIRDEMNVIDEKIASGIGSVDFSADIFKVKMDGEPEIEIPLEKKEGVLTIERAIYDPCKRDFVEGRLPRMKDWIERHDPGAYWFAMSIQNNTDKTIEEWDVELGFSSALKTEEAKIEGIEIKIPHEAHLKSFKISVPKEYGVVIPKGGAQRVYFKLRAEKPKTTYEISGIFKSEITGDVPIRTKEFKYLCDTGVSAEAVKVELKKTFSEKEAARLALSFKTVQELDRMCDREAKTDEYRGKLLVLRNYTEGFSNNFSKQVDGFSRFMKEEQSGYLDDEYKGKVRRFCTNLVDVWISEFLKG
jgi:tetratricopeptide (TPR) repeat protein